MIDGVKKLLVLVMLAFCLSCVKKSPYDYLADDLGKLSDEQKSWIIALENTTNAENRFSAINKIAQNLKRKNKTLSNKRTNGSKETKFHLLQRLYCIT